METDIHWLVCSRGLHRADFSISLQQDSVPHVTSSVFPFFYLHVFCLGYYEPPMTTKNCRWNWSWSCLGQEFQNLTVSQLCPKFMVKDLHWIRYRVFSHPCGLVQFILIRDVSSLLTISLGRSQHRNHMQIFLYSKLYFCTITTFLRHNTVN